LRKIPYRHGASFEVAYDFLPDCLCSFITHNWLQSERHPVPGRKTLYPLLPASTLRKHPYDRYGNGSGPNVKTALFSGGLFRSFSVCHVC
jgi:hypothetical protein